MKSLIKPNAARTQGTWGILYVPLVTACETAGVVISLDSQWCASATLVGLLQEQEHNKCD